jgi:hypothetical protein
MKHIVLLVAALSVLAGRAHGQDTTGVQDAIYQRPFIGAAGNTSIGGYVEGNTNYFVTDGVSEGFSMELRRFNVFLYAAVSRRVKFISELEFEHGTEEIALETALVDFQIDPAFVLRGGILLPPLGAFNQNHDSPLWEFVERPLVSTEIIPATLSEVGFGFYGRVFRRPVAFTYDLYVTNGLGDGVVSNEQGRTHLASGKGGGLFEEDNNGSPALSGRLAARHRRLGEGGLSFYTGHYNAYASEGVRVDERRRLSLVALDFNTELLSAGIRGEVALARVDVQEDLEELFGERQWGGHLDLVVPVLRPRLFGYEEAVVNANLRLEAVDFNAGAFRTTGKNIYDELYVVVPGVSFRPTPSTVFRANYRRQWYRDLVGNPVSRTGGFQVGLASYF